PLLTGTPQLYPEHAEVVALVANAVAQSDEVGAVEIGTITGPIKRAYANESTEDRGAESSLGNLIADIQLWATSNESFAGVPAQIGIMNSGGLRADLEADDDGGPVTYREVAAVQPFANRSEEHTSELQSRENLVCRLLL